MTMQDLMNLDSFDAEAERQQFLAFGLRKQRFSRTTYGSDEAIDHRTKVIFHTFARTLVGRGELPDHQRNAEMRTLCDVLRNDMIYPLLHSSQDFSASQAVFDSWHRASVQTLKAQCPVEWNGGTVLTVGMAQKILNLHCKSLWALGLVPERCYVRFHAAIDNNVLELLRRKQQGWTRCDSYEKYMGYQHQLRQVAEKRGTYPLAVESWYWYRHSKMTKDDRRRRAS